MCDNISAVARSKLLASGVGGGGGGGGGLNYRMIVIIFLEKNTTLLGLSPPPYGTEHSG